MMCVSGGWSVRRRSSLLEMRAVQEMRNIHRRHHWPNASRFLVSCRVRDHVFAPQRMTGRMKTRVVTWWEEMEEYQIYLRSMKQCVLLQCVSCMISCSLDLLLRMSTARYVKDSMISTLYPATDTRELGGLWDVSYTSFDVQKDDSYIGRAREGGRVGTDCPGGNELRGTLLLSNFQVYRHIKVIPVSARVYISSSYCISNNQSYISCARRPAPLHTRYTNRLNPGNNRGIYETSHYPGEEASVITARSELRKVLFLALSVSFFVCV